MRSVSNSSADPKMFGKRFPSLYTARRRRCQARVPDRANPDIMPNVHKLADEIHAPLILSSIAGSLAGRVGLSHVRPRDVAPCHQGAAPLGAFGPSFLRTFHGCCGKAGLVAPTVYGYPDHKDYILEAVGCGCAFLDYDNDGWMDIFVLTGTRMNGSAAGSDEPPLQEQSRRHVHRRDRKGGLARSGLGLRRVRRRLQQRRLRGPVLHVLWAEQAVSQ